jgi:hypothetical protein
MVRLIVETPWGNGNAKSEKSVETNLDAADTSVRATSKRLEWD